MPACEECWTSAYTIARLTGRHQAEVYRELMAASPKSHYEELSRLTGIDPDTGRYTCCGTDALRTEPFHAAGCPNRAT
jgi:hypothetical protein